MPLAQHTQNARYWLMPSLEGLAASYPPVIRFQVTFAIIERHKREPPWGSSDLGIMRPSTLQNTRRNMGAMTRGRCVFRETVSPALLCRAGV